MSNPRQDFRRKYYTILKEYGHKSQEKALKAVYKYLDNLNTKITEKTVTRINNLIAEIYSNEYVKIKPQVKKLVKPYYQSQKYRYKIRKGNELQKAEYVSYNLSQVDWYAVNMLSKADMLWVLNHAGNTETARLIAGALYQNIEAGLTGYELAGVLKSKFAEYTQEEYAKIFGEDRYWQMVVNNNVQRTSGIANINSMAEAGATEYQWVTRETERTCEICAALHEKTFSIKHAQEHIDKFYEATERNNIEDMKDAMPFLNSEEEALKAFGVVPPAHHNCECDIVII
jgi:hypothetical protein